MARKSTSVDTDAYSSTARKVLVLGTDGASMASASNPLPVDASVTVGTVELEAQMNTTTGHDFYKTTSNVGDDTDTITFDTVTGLALEDIQTVENKTQGWIYKTKGATVTNTTVVIDMAEQEIGAPVPGATDEFEIVYRGDSRLTDASQKSQIVDDSGNVVGATSNALDVNLASDNTGGVEAIQDTASDLNMTEASAADIKTAVELIDDAVYTDGAGTPSKGVLVMGTDGTNPQALSCNTDGELKVNLEAGDIEIGAVEIKNADSDVRVEVSAANTARTTASNVLSVQGIDAAGNVLDTASLALESGGNLDDIATDSGTIASDTASIDGKITACDTGNVVIASGTVTAVTDITNTVVVDATGQGDVPITLDGETVELGAGTASIGTLGANSGVDIGDVDVTSLPDVDINDISKGTQTNDIKVTLDTEVVAVDATGQGDVPITLDSEVVTVDSTDLDIRDLTHVSDSVQIGDGTETALVNASGELQVRDDDANTDLDTIAGDTTSIDGKITACDTDSVTPAGKSSSVLTSSGQIKGSAGTVYAILVSGVGVTAGDKVEIKNSTDDSGASLATIVADAANGTWAFYPAVGISYDTGIYSDETIADAGTFTVTVVYE